MESVEFAAVATADMNDAVVGWSGKVMTDLSLKTVDKAQRALMSIQESDNGFEAWRVLVRMGEGGGGIKKAGLLRQLLRVDFSGDFLDRMNL